MRGAIGGLLGDDALRGRLATAARRLQAEPGQHHAADLIERVATTGEPVTD